MVKTKVQFPKFGSHIAFDKILYRQALDSNWHKVRWETGGVLGLYSSKPETRKGIVIGYRWLRNGELDGGYEDDPITFKAIGEPVPAVLVAWHPRRKPVLVPMDGIGGKAK